jgi:glycosyltransferase involved in cell wall biosynthesis
MIPMPTVSIIIPAFNAAAHIDETLDSVRQQTYANWECIIVNDGSTDNSRETIQAFIKDDPRFKLIDIPNSGVCAARNTAVRYAEGTYLFPLDSDDRIAPSCIARCLDEFDKKPGLRLVCPQGQLFGAETGLWVLPEFEYRTMLHHNMIHNSSLFRKTDFERIGGYRTNMKHGLEDWDFFIALLYKATPEEVIQLKEPLFYYRVSNNGRRMTAAAGLRQSEMMDLIVYNNFRIYREYFPDIFHRIQDYDFQKTMLDKKPVQWMIRTMIGASAFKNKLFRKKTAGSQ